MRCARPMWGCSSSRTTSGSFATCTRTLSTCSSTGASFAPAARSSRPSSSRRVTSSFAKPCMQGRRRAVAVTVKTPTVKASPLDVGRIRKDFPILAQTVRGKPLVYLDNAATSQKPRQVIDSMTRVFEEHNANIHRGVYEFSERTTAAFEEARAKVARFINAPSEREVIFVRNATEGLNLVAYAWGRDNIKRGDRIVTTVLEHHSAFPPSQQLAPEAAPDAPPLDIHAHRPPRRDHPSP